MSPRKQINHNSLWTSVKDYPALPMDLPLPASISDKILLLHLCWLSKLFMLYFWGHWWLWFFQGLICLNWDANIFREYAAEEKGLPVNKQNRWCSPLSHWLADLAAGETFGTCGPSFQKGSDCSRRVRVQKAVLISYSDFMPVPHFFWLLWEDITISLFSFITNLYTLV